MASNESKIDVAGTPDALRTFEQTTVAGEVHTEAVAIADPENINEVARVTSSKPSDNESGVVVRPISPPIWREIFYADQSTHGSLPSGSPITVHPVFNTEPNAIDSGWIETFDGAEYWINQNLVVNSNANLNVYVVNATANDGTGIQNEGFPFLNVTADVPADIGARLFSRYFRIIVENVSGSSATEYEVRSVGGTGNAEGVTVSIGQPLFDQIPAQVNRSISAGKVPDGQHDNQRLGGTKTLSPTPAPLGISAVYESDAIDTERYPTLLLLVGADQPSADQGIEILWSDTESFTTVRSSRKVTFRTGNINDSLLIPERTRARWLKIKYTNGLTAQGRFFLNLQLDITPIADEVDLKPMTAGSTGQQDVTLTASKIATSILPGRRAMRVKNLSSSAHPIFYGFDQGVTTLTGDELAVGESVDLDIDEFVDVYVITTSVGGGGDRVSWTQIGTS